MQFSGRAPSMNISVTLKIPHTTTGELRNDTLQWGLPAPWTMSDKKSVKQLPQSCLDATLFPQSAGYINSFVHKSCRFRADPIPTEQRSRPANTAYGMFRGITLSMCGYRTTMKSYPRRLSYTSGTSRPPSSFTSMPKN